MFGQPWLELDHIWVAFGQPSGAACIVLFFREHSGMARATRDRGVLTGGGVSRNNSHTVLSRRATPRGDREGSEVFGGLGGRISFGVEFPVALPEAAMTNTFTSQYLSEGQEIWILAGESHSSSVRSWPELSRLGQLGRDVDNYTRRGTMSSDFDRLCSVFVLPSELDQPWCDATNSTRSS